MSELDFSGIEPARVPEVKRKLYAIRAYLDAPTQNGEATIRTFAECSMSGPTLNQHPAPMARSSSLMEPENQCNMGVPDSGASNSECSRSI